MSGKFEPKYKVVEIMRDGHMMRFLVPIEPETQYVWPVSIKYEYVRRWQWLPRWARYIPGLRRQEWTSSLDKADTRK